MRRHLAALTLFTILTGLMAFPVLTIMARGGVPGWEGDNLYYVHSMWWWKHAIFELRTSPFFDPESFVPAGRENGRSELTVTKGGCVAVDGGAFCALSGTPRFAVP